jgi:hypothetical protein
VARAVIGPPTIRAEPGDLRSMRSLSEASARQKIFGDMGAFGPSVHALPVTVGHPGLAAGNGLAGR